MQKILFIGHSYHKKTQSHKFLMDLLQTQFFVDDHYVTLNKDKNKHSFQDLPHDTAYDSVIFWQIKPHKCLIKNIRYKKIFFFPMYDACSKWQIEKWANLYNVHILCFSKTLYNRLCDYGLYASYFQYFPALSNTVDTGGDTQSCFHWFRRSEIKTNILSKLIPNLKKIHIHQAPDPHFFVSDNQIPVSLEVSISEWFNNKQDLHNTMKNSTLYLSPRLEEGIGMSFLEAMAQARCVIAPNIPTMNEYIQHKVTGLLYDIHNPQIFDITDEDIRNIQENTLLFMQNGYQKWHTDQEHILNILRTQTQTIPPRPMRYYKHILWRLFKNPFKIKRLIAELKESL